MLDILILTRKFKSPMDRPSFIIRQLAAMLASGMGASEALGILEGEKHESRPSVMSSVLRIFSKETQNKDSVFEKTPAWFKHLLASIEASGNPGKDTPLLLHQIADSQENVENMKERLTSALTYPVTLMMIAAVITGMIMVFVIPTFVDMYASFGENLPGPTKTLIHCSNVIVKHGVWFVIALILAIKLLKTELIRDSVLYMLSLTGAGHPVHVFSNVMFSRTLSIMLCLKAPWDKALAVSIESVPNRFHARRFKMAFTDPSGPESLAEVLEATGLYPPSTVRIFKAGEACGTLETSLAEISRYQEKNLVSQFDGLAKSLDLILLILSSLVIGFIIIALYLPIFEMGSIAG